MKPDLDNKDNIKQFIDLFYQQVLEDDVLAHIFLDVVKIDVAVHIPIIRRYWEKLLLGEQNYKRHTMNIHRDIHDKFPLSEKEFERWLSLFVTTAETYYEGEKTDRAIQVASTIAFNMDVALNNKRDTQTKPIT